MAYPCQPPIQLCEDNMSSTFEGQALAIDDRVWCNTGSFRRGVRLFSLLPGENPESRLGPLLFNLGDS
jgi:hypothetical protein